MTTNNAANIIDVTSGLALPYQKISSQTASSSSVIDFSSIPSGYSAFFVTLNRIRPATDGALLYLRTGTGGTYASSSYTNLINFIDSIDGQSSYKDSDGAGSEVRLTANYGVSSGSGDHGVCGCLELTSMNTAVSPAVATFRTMFYTGSRRVMTQGACRGESSGATDCIRFLFSTGNISSGTFTLYGLIA